MEDIRQTIIQEMTTDIQQQMHEQFPSLPLSQDNNTTSEKIQRSYAATVQQPHMQKITLIVQSKNKQKTL